MSRINEGDIVKMLQPGMNTRFFKNVAEAPKEWPQIADFVKSNYQTETYPWLGGLPDPVLFEGERKMRKLSEYSWQVNNAEYEQTVGIKRSTLDDDQYGQLNGLAGRMGVTFANWLNKSVFALLPLTATNLCYDGQFMVDTDHAEANSGTQSNKGTTAFSSTTYATARAAMMNFKDDQGNPAGKMGNLLVIPPALEQAGFQVVKAQTYSSNNAAIPNVFANTADILMSRWLTDTDNWYLLDTTGDKPFIMQERIPLEVGFMGKDSEDGFKRLTFQYGSYWRGAFAFGDWRNIYGAIV